MRVHSHPPNVTKVSSEEVLEREDRLTGPDEKLDPGEFTKLMDHLPTSLRTLRSQMRNDSFRHFCAALEVKRY
jgi:hypothetical protein